jgi:hypothetical protein
MGSVLADFIRIGVQVLLLMGGGGAPIARVQLWIQIFGRDARWAEKWHQTVSALCFVSIANTKIARFRHIDALTIASFSFSKTMSIGANFIDKKSRFRLIGHLNSFPNTRPLKPVCRFSLDGVH